MGVHVNLIAKLYGAAEPRVIEPRKHPVAVQTIIRANWYTMLTTGVGAKALSKALGDNDVPVMKRWELNNRRNADDACRANAGQGWIRNSDDFSTGHGQPPAHPGCRCRIRLSVQGGDPTLNGTMKPLTQPRFINLNRRQRRAPTFNPTRLAVPSELRRVRVPEIANGIIDTN